MNEFIEQKTTELENILSNQINEYISYGETSGSFTEEIKKAIQESYTKGVEDAIGIIRNFKVSLRNNPTKVPIDLVELIEQLKEQYNGRSKESS